MSSGRAAVGSGGWEGELACSEAGAGRGSQEVDGVQSDEGWGARRAKATSGGCCAALQHAPLVSATSKTRGSHLAVKVRVGN